MKKVDEASGMTIEIPTDMNIRAEFPYPGFWAAAYPKLVSALKEHGESLRNENTSTINDALTSLIELANGEYAVVLAERIWYIGEILNTNSTLPVRGRAGTALGYIKESQDGGRMAIAARVFENPVRAIIDHGMGSVRAGNELSSLLDQHSNSQQSLQNLTRQLEQIEQDAPTHQEVAQRGEQCKTLAAEADRAGELLTQTQAHLEQMETLRTQYNAVKKEYEAEVAQIKQLQNYIQSQQASRNKGQSEAASRELRPIMQRAQSKGVWLSRIAATADDSMLADMQRMLQIRRTEQSNLQGQYGECLKEHQQMTTTYNNAVTNGKAVWAEMVTISAHIESMTSNITNAQTAMSAFTDVEASKLIRIWVAHLRECRIEVEGLLFEAKAIEVGAVTGSPMPMLAESLVDPAMVKDHEDYIDALDMIGDALTNEEYELVEQIGRLGLSMGYVPGASRILALSEMRKSTRLVAYRNLVEEILSQGQKLSSSDKWEAFETGIPGFGPFVFENDEDLAEMKELLRHLADSRLNFKYGGGN
jgi:hypothetical protein